MSRFRALFMGSNRFSLPTLRSLLSGDPVAGKLDVAAVVTQPDRPAGRGRRPRTNAVKNLAQEHGLTVLQPERLRDPEALASIQAVDPDLIVVAAYGQILPRALLDIPAHRSLNLHPSLLPRYRGPSPVAGAILNGDRTTGASLMLMAPRMDAGPILAQRPTDVGPEETAGELEDRLAEISAQLLLDSLPAWLAGELEPVEQKEEEASYTGLVTKDDARVDWSLPAEQVSRRVRAYNPWPVAHCLWDERALRILRAGHGEGRGIPGAILELTAEGLAVACGEGALLIREMQLPGGKPLPADAVIRGHPGLLGARLV